MQNDIENILNVIAAKDSQVLCREVLSISLTPFNTASTISTWTNSRGEGRAKGHYESDACSIDFSASRKSLGESPVSRLKYLPKN